MENHGNGFARSLEKRRQLDDLFSNAYEELRRLASAVKRNDGNATLSPAALVNEAWLKLAHSPAVASTSRLHFKRIAARAMRQVLVEAARRRNTSKRGGQDGVVFVTLDEAVNESKSCSHDLLPLEEALEELERIEPRQARLIDSRFYGGLDVAEIAELLQISEVTVARDWRAARAWLAVRLRER